MPINGATLVDPGYPDHASLVWRAVTPAGPVTVRTSRVKPPYYDFWYVLNRLYGVSPWETQRIVRVLATMAECSSFRVPKVFGSFAAGEQQYVMLEWLSGVARQDFAAWSMGEIADFAAKLAQLHNHTWHYYGNPATGAMGGLTAYHAALATVLEDALARFAGLRSRYGSCSAAVLNDCRRLPAPQACTITMPDFGASQFLVGDNLPLAVIDVETCVIAPAAMDLIAVEMQLNQNQARVFQSSYGSVRPWPELSAVRIPYRYFLLVIEAQGEASLDQWLEAPAWFA